MPTYDYKCKKCEHRFEVLQRMSDDPIKICPECKGEVYRLISGGTGLIFKGSGFYITDYKDKKGNGDSAANDTGEKKSDTKKSDDKKTETKTAKKESKKTPSKKDD